MNAIKSTSGAKANPMAPMNTVKPDHMFVLLETLNQAFPGEMQAIQAAKSGFDMARFAQVQAQRQGHMDQALRLLTEGYSTRIALQMSVLRLGFSIFYYALIRDEHQPKE